MAGKRFQFELDTETRLALIRLSEADERTCAAQLRYMIRTEAAKRGLWTPKRPELVKNAKTDDRRCKHEN